MSVKNSVRLAARKLGIEIARYDATQSLSARLGVQFAANRIDCVLDVGANDGGYARLVRSAGFAGTIVSFEPLPEAHAKLVAASSKDPAWITFPRIALGDAAAEVEINVAANSTSSSIFRMLPSHVEAAPASKYVRTERVAVSRLDSLAMPAIESADRIFLKIDTQGYEMPVLRGAVGMLDKVVGVQLEMSVVPLYEGQALYEDLLTWLKLAGFEMWGVEPGFMSRSTGRMLQFDGIFFKPSGRVTRTITAPLT